MDSDRAVLQENAAWFAGALRSDGWDTAGTTSQIVPVIIGENAAALAAAEFLQHEGFAVRAIRPPTVPEGTARLRFSLTAAISRSELAQLVGSLSLWRAQAPRLAAVSCA
jgi:8-amino-7-oxononanoate synthase